MASGIEVRNANAQKIIGASGRLTRIRYSTVAESDQSGQVTLPDINGKETVQFSFPLDEQNYGSSHEVTRSGNTIRWSPLTVRASNGNQLSRISSLILVFLY